MMGSCGFDEEERSWGLCNLVGGREKQIPEQLLSAPY